MAGLRILGGIALVGALTVSSSCSDESSSDGSTPAVTDEKTIESPPPDSGRDTSTTAGTRPEAAMRITIDLHPDAVWSDGTPISVADFVCTWQAVLGTPGSVSTGGWGVISSISEGETERQVVVEFPFVNAAYRTVLRDLIKADEMDDCSDVSEEFVEPIDWSAGPYRLDRWGPTGSVFVRNESYWGTERQNFDEVEFVAMPDARAQARALRAGEVDFIFPQTVAGLEEELADPDVAVRVAEGRDFEALFFQQRDGSLVDHPFADPIFREAFSRSIDREALFERLYAPLASDATLLQCGPWVGDGLCDGDEYVGSFDPEGAEALLTREGWTRDEGGMWTSPDGVVPLISWMVNTESSRRLAAQTLLIPQLRDAGFDVVADNCDAACVFQDRLPTLDYDLAMFITSIGPDPSTLGNGFHCDEIPTAENRFVGLNFTGWCNREASELIRASDFEMDASRRTELIRAFLEHVHDDHVLLPLFQFPRTAASRTDRVGGPVDAEISNLDAFRNWGEWTDVDGDGRLVIAAEQWPECLNPITACVSSSWAYWTAVSPMLPSVWDTTNDHEFTPSPLVVDEPAVEIL